MEYGIREMKYGKDNLKQVRLSLMVLEKVSAPTESLG